jgi:uncharacterized protein YbjT (DUF2867 family)
MATTLVVGGNGKTGRRVVQRLRAAHVPVVVASRSGARRFDWEDETTWPSAVRGVSTAYVTYAPDLAFSGAADRVGGFAELAVASGVRRLVLLSGRSEPEAQRAERLVQASGAEWTVVRSSFFAQNFSEGFLADSIRAGMLAFPAGAVGEPFVDLEDVADVVAAALLEDRHVGRIYEVTGPRLLSFASAVDAIAAAAGRDIRYLQTTLEEFAAAMAAEGLPGTFVTELTGLFRSVLDGRNAYLTDGVAQALGRAPRDFADYARDAAASGVWWDESRRVS